MSVGIFTGMLQNFPKNRDNLVQKLCVEKKLSKSVFSCFKTRKTKKNLMAIKLEGGILCEHVGCTFILPYLDSCHKEQNFSLLSIGSKYILVENKSLFNLKLSSILCPNPNMYIGQHVNSNKVKIIKFITGGKVWNKSGGKWFKLLFQFLFILMKSEK